jgi:putative flippase GtrA
MNLKIFTPETLSLVKFALIGAIGFTIDAGLLYLGVYVLSTPLFATRAVSILISVLATWLLNRSWTFKLRKIESVWIELFKYLGSRSVGAAINMGIFTSLVSLATMPFNNPILATPISSAITMLINYTMLRLFIYVPK